MSVADGFELLLGIVLSKTALFLLGLALESVAFLIPVFDVFRMHREKTNEKTEMIKGSEALIRNKLADKEEEMHRFREQGSSLLGHPVTYSVLHDELKEAIRGQRDMLEHVDKIRFQAVIDDRVSTGKSARRSLYATLLFLTGAAFSLASQLV